MTTLSKEEYLAQSRGLMTGFGPTTDFADPQLGRTAQHEEGIPEQSNGLPGQVFTIGQLPSPANALAYGMPPQTVPEHLIVESVNHVQGMDSLDVASADLRATLGDPATAYDGTVRSQADALQVFADNTGAGLGDPSEKDDSTVFVDGVAGGGMVEVAGEPGWGRRHGQAQGGH